MEKYGAFYMKKSNIYLEEDRVRLAGTVVTEDELTFPSAAAYVGGSLDPADGSLEYRHVMNRPGIGCAPGLFVGKDDVAACSVHGDLKTVVIGGFTTTNVPVWLDQEFEVTDEARDAIEQALGEFVETNDLEADAELSRTELAVLVQTLVPVELFEIQVEERADDTGQAPVREDPSLEELPGIDPRGLKALRGAGIDSPADLAGAQAEVLADLPGITTEQAKRLQKTAREAAAGSIIADVEFDDDERTNQQIHARLDRAGFTTVEDVVRLEVEELAREARLPAELARTVIERAKALRREENGREGGNGQPAKGPESPAVAIAEAMVDGDSSVTAEALGDDGWFSDRVTAALNRLMDDGRIDIVDERPERLPREYDDLERFDRDREVDLDEDDLDEEIEWEPPRDVTPIPPFPADDFFDPALGGTLLVKDVSGTVTAAIDGEGRRFVAGPDVVTSVDSDRHGEVAVDDEEARCVLDGEDGRLDLGGADADGVVQLVAADGEPSVEVLADDEETGGPVIRLLDDGEPAATVSTETGGVTVEGADGGIRATIDGEGSRLSVDGDDDEFMTFDAADGTLEVSGDIVCHGDVLDGNGDSDNGDDGDGDGGNGDDNGDDGV